MNDIICMHFHDVLQSQEGRERTPYRRDSVVTLADDDEMVSAEDGQQRDAVKKSISRRFLM